MKRMIPCRLCVLSDPHVHVSDSVVAAVHMFNKKRTKLKLRKIRNIDWTIPAINYAGTWHKVSIDFLEQVWPLVREQVMRSRPRPPHQDEDNEGVQPEGD